MSMFNKNDIIEMALQIEKKGYDFYATASQKKNLSSKVAELLIYLRDEEKVHAQIFGELREKLDMIELKNEDNWEETKNYIQAMVESHIFNSPQQAINLATKAANEKEIIEYAIAFEKDTLLFFHTFKDQVKNKKGIETIQKIIDEEIAHVLKLKNFLVNL